MYLLFCVLLIMNGVGCDRMKHRTKLTGLTPLAAGQPASREMPAPMNGISRGPGRYWFPVF